MQRPRTLPAFTREEADRTHRLLATHVAFMMGRKLEEGDWANIYCQAKGIPLAGWSNLNIDITHNGIGVEQKMLRQPSDKPLRDICGTRLMHPSATRSIRIPSLESDPNEAMHDILTQYAELLEERKKKVREISGNLEPDMRTGWLLWQANLRQFLYFEEETIPPDPSDYFAEWKESSGGVRKPSKNLWVYEKETGQKRYSITTSAGAKIQPYFDVPPPTDKNVYFFTVQHEELGNGLVRIWVTAQTSRILKQLVGELSIENLALAIETAASNPIESDISASIQLEEANEILLSEESYELLATSFPGVSDEHMMQLFIQRLSSM